MACGGTVGAAICRPGVSAPAEGRFHEGCAPHCVVAKSAGLRFRLRRKLRPLPCASSPHRAGRGGGPGLRHQKENGPRPVEEKKALRRASVQWPSARDGGRRIGASVDFALPSGTLQSSAKSVLLSRGGWCRPRRGARTHLGCFSFTVSRCGAPSISVTSVPLVPPSARSACPQGGRDIRSAAKPRTAVQRKAAKPPTAAQSLRATGAVEVDCASRWLRVFLDGNDLPRPVRGLIQRPEGGDTGAAGPQGACFVVAGLGIVHP